MRTTEKRVRVPSTTYSRFQTVLTGLFFRSNGSPDQVLGVRLSSIYPVGLRRNRLFRSPRLAFSLKNNQLAILLKSAVLTVEKRLAAGRRIASQKRRDISLPPGAQVITTTPGGRHRCRVVRRTTNSPEITASKLTVYQSLIASPVSQGRSLAASVCFEP